MKMIPKNPIRALLLAAALLPMACSAGEKDDAYRLNVHYKETRTAPLVVSPERIVVAEVFWYGCPHCYAFDPYVEKWKASLADDVEFVRIPASLGRPSGMTHSRVYYTAQLLDVLDEVHVSMFNAIHRENRQMTSESELVTLFEAHGVDRERFLSVFNGFAVDNMVRKAETAIRDFGISSVPSVVVNDRYWTNGRYAGDFNKLLSVTDFLVDKARERRAN